MNSFKSWTGQHCNDDAKGLTRSERRSKANVVGLVNFVQTVQSIAALRMLKVEMSQFLHSCAAPKHDQ